MSGENYPRVDGAFLQLGPEVFTGDGVEQPQDVIMWKGAAYTRLEAGDALDEHGARRTWTGEAKAAFDQAVTEAGGQAGFPSPDFWVARAQAAAAIESAEQARIANLIAWKALQTQRQSGGVQGLPTGEDEISEQIEKGLGL